MLMRSRLKVWGVILILGSFDFDATFVVLGSKLKTELKLMNFIETGWRLFYFRMGQTCGDQTKS